MAMTGAIWGIDVGQCALKALRCFPHDDEEKIVADAFDYIEYPKILSQAGADPAELVNDALKQFLSRNSVRGDRVAISVAGQSGLARFIRLPPVEAKKIPDIVRYEARQQIPFDLNDVIWDYQRMGGGSEEEGFALETEIGLFAMKRDAVFRTLEPFEKVGIEIDFVQLTPLALYNFALFDQLHDLPPPDEYDPDNPPKSIVVLSLGTDATDLVVTNGYRVWQRSIPLGGNHFTKALTKELKLTFAKAEHLKRNATTAQDPKAVFQAMRPVFSDLLTEVQRSIGYFTSIDRAAKISRIVALGNAMKLPGLRRYLSQSLGFQLDRLDEFRNLAGAKVLAAPAFKENSLCFGVCYGLALQGLGRSGLRTNLLPNEIVKDRLIRQKKPWAVAAAAVLLLACGISFGTFSRALSGVDEDRWEKAEGVAATTKGQADELVRLKNEAEEEFEGIDEIGINLVGNVERRILWLELLRTLNQCLPQYESAEPAPEEDPTDNRPQDVRIAEREELHVTNLECEYVDDLSAWYSWVRQMNPVWYQPPEEDQGGAKSGGPGGTAAANASSAAEPGAGPVQEGPTGPGWVVMLTGHHYHNRQEQRPKVGQNYVRETLIKNLHTKEISLPGSDRTIKTWFTKELGISYPVLVDPQGMQDEVVTNPNLAVKGDSGGGRGASGSAAPENAGVKLRRFDFLVHFCWQQTTPTEREKKREEDQKEQNQATD